MKKKVPEKLFYTISEVSKLVSIKPHVLRYWESEFGFLKPKKSVKGHRLFRKQDIEIVLRIKELLYTEGFTIEGARKQLWRELRRGEVSTGKLKQELKEMLKLFQPQSQDTD